VSPRPWLIVTTGWPVVTVAAGHALAAAGARPLAVAAVGTLAAVAVMVGSLVLLRHRGRAGAGPRSTS
jgi:hypothetical protein